MTKHEDVVEAAVSLNRKSVDALELLLGMQEKAIEKDPLLAEKPLLEPKYEENLMGPIDDLKALGRRIALRWNKELYGVICSGEKDETRTQLLSALKITDAAALGVIATALIAVGAPAAIAAALAPLLLKKFIYPAQEELCSAWGEAISAQK